MNFLEKTLLKKKIIFKKLEIIYKIYNFIHSRYVLINFRLKKDLTFLKCLLIKQKCLISNRTRSSYKICGLSRFKIKEFLSLGLIPNLKKLSW